jgi:hypothetical protein
LPALLLMVGSALTADFNQSYPARALPVQFESRANEWAVTKWLSRNLRSRCCSLCLERFNLDPRDEKLKYSVAVDKVRLHFVHQECIKPLSMHVLFDGYCYPDTQHFLTADSRGSAPRVVIGDTSSTTRAALLQVVSEITDGRMAVWPPAGGKTVVQ